MNWLYLPDDAKDNIVTWFWSRGRAEELVDQLNGLAGRYLATDGMGTGGSENGEQGL